MKWTAILSILLTLQFGHLHATTLQENGLEDNSIVHPTTEAECTNAGKQWDPEVNRCLYTQETVDTRENFQDCANASDPEACHMGLAEDMSGVKKGQGISKQDENLSTGGAAVASLYSVMLGAGMFSAQGGGGGGMCISKMLFMGTSIAWLGGDLFLKYSAKKKFKELTEEYDKEAKNSEKKGGETSSYESQIRAFMFLKKEQMIVKQHAKHRFTMHIMATAGYGISAVMALMDMMRGSSSCGGSGGDADAGATADAGTGDAGAATTGDAGAASGPKPNLSSPPMIMISSVAMAGINGMLAKKMKDAEKLAESRIEILDDIMNTFIETMAGFCPDGREDLSNPRCYCYTDTGEKNSNRTNSAICNNLWEQDFKNFHVDPSQYDIAQNVSQGCITVNGKFDLECKCKGMINTETGQNACYKTQVATSAQLAGMNQGLGVSSVASSLDSVTSGASTAIGGLNANSLGEKAARANRAFGRLVDKAKASGVDLGPIKRDSIDDESFAQTYAKKMTSPSLLAEAKKGLLSSLAADARPPGGAFSDAIAQAEETADKKAPELQVTGGKGTAALNQSGKKKKKFRFNWNEDAKKSIENYTEQEKQQVSAMVSDIVKEENVSIWDVISNRYISSGLKRLFDKNEK